MGDDPHARPEVDGDARAVERGAAGMKSFCMRCRAEREMLNPVTATMKNGKPSTSGVCRECGTRLYAFGAPKKEVVK